MVTEDKDSEDSVRPHYPLELRLEDTHIPVQEQGLLSRADQEDIHTDRT
ncbi:MAG: hypothetical protein AABX54_00195 [Nanoarchaeota archaeon]